MIVRRVTKLEHIHEQGDDLKRFDQDELQHRALPALNRIAGNIDMRRTKGGGLTLP